MSLRRFLLPTIAALLAALSLSAQETGSQKDSLVRLLSAKSMQLIEENGVSYRKVTGPARFLHNETYLLCDTALWNVKTNEIFAIDHVKILQDQTVLTSDRLTYYVDRDLAQFRGALVQLEDKDRNILRTENLDYSAARKSADAGGGVEGNGAGRDSLDIHCRVLAESHYRAFAEIFLYLRYRSFKRFLFICHVRSVLSGS